MNPDDATPAHPAPGAAAPDEPDHRAPDVARALDVAPLDEVTRRRMVQTALARATEEPVGSQRRHRTIAALGIAASLAVGVAVGAAIVTRPEAPSTPTAAGSDQERSSSTAGADAPDAAAPEAVSPAPPRSLGDLGPQAGVAELAAAVDARLQEGASGRSEDATALPGPCADLPAAELAVVSVVGTATLDGRAVAVQVGPARRGENLVVALDAATCAVVASTPLPT